MTILAETAALQNATSLPLELSPAPIQPIYKYMQMAELYTE